MALAILDLTSFKEVCNGDTEFEKELFEDFLEGAEDSLEFLAKCCQEDQPLLWKEKSHYLKGTAKNLGAMQLGELCCNAEENYQVAIDKKKIYFSAIKEALEIVRQKILEEMAK